MVNIIIGKVVNKKYVGPVIGVDSSAVALLNSGYKDFIAVGDFDSCSSDEFELIKSNCTVVKHPQQKDYSDLELAIDYALEHFDGEDITIHNIYAGNRLDHLFANLLLLKKGLDKGVTIYQTDKKNCAYVLKPNKYGLATLKKYVSFFALENVSDLTLDNFKYPLSNYALNVGDPLCVSNELLPGAILTFSDGLILVIESSD